MKRQFLKLLYHIKSRSSLPQVGCARGANTFPSHNQSLTLESLTMTSTFGFPSNLQWNTRWRLPNHQSNKWKSPTDAARVTCDKYPSIKNNFGIYSHTLHNRTNKQTNKKEFQHSPRLTINQLIHVLQFPKVVQSLLVPVAWSPDHVLVIVDVSFPPT
jgi:hypothetical protein